MVSATNDMSPGSHANRETRVSKILHTHICTDVCVCVCICAKIDVYASIVQFKFIRLHIDKEVERTILFRRTILLVFL